MQSTVNTSAFWWNNFVFISTWETKITHNYFDKSPRSILLTKNETAMLSTYPFSCPNRTRTRTCPITLAMSLDLDIPLNTTSDKGRWTWQQNFTGRPVWIRVRFSKSFWQCFGLSYENFSWTWTEHFYWSEFQKYFLAPVRSEFFAGINEKCLKRRHFNNGVSIRNSYGFKSG